MKKQLFELLTTALLASSGNSEEAANASSQAPSSPAPTTSPSVPPEDSNPPAAPAKRSAAEKLADLENRSLIPKLDRSDSLEGPDQDNNGIRDDVDAYIAQHYPEPAQRKAAEQFARAMQLAVTGGSASVDAARSIRRQSSEAISCLYDRFDGTNGSKYPAAVGKELTRITTNTKPRLKAYLAYNKTLSGTSWATPEGDNCEK